MFPQTHVYFAQRVCLRLSDALVLGSIFPDVAITVDLNRTDSHARGKQLLAAAPDDELTEFAIGAITHGIDPFGLDYYCDEQLPGYERGYCFEKGRKFTDATIRACNIPSRMGWWKAHNIIEMGVELGISASGPYAEILAGALANERLVNKISRFCASFYEREKEAFHQKIRNFAHYIVLSRATPASLAQKYQLQMLIRHRVQINTSMVARLIAQAQNSVSTDIEDFMCWASNDIRKTLKKLVPSLIPEKSCNKQDVYTVRIK